MYFNLGETGVADGTYGSAGGTSTAPTNANGACPTDNPADSTTRPSDKICIPRFTVDKYGRLNSATTVAVVGSGALKITDGVLSIKLAVDSTSKDVSGLTNNNNNFPPNLSHGQKCE